MDEKEKKSLTVYLIALSVILSNLIILSVIYQVPFIGSLPAVHKALPFVSMAAVYPYDIFQIYLKDNLTVHFFWIVSVGLAGFGLLFFNYFAYIIFLVFIILHFVVLALVTLFHFGHYEFWGYFFKCYFNMVAFLFYAGYLTLPETRVQFTPPKNDGRWNLWFWKVRRKALGPKDAEGLFNLGLAYYRLGRVEEAVEYLKRAIEYVPEKPEYHFYLGKIMVERAQYSEAIHALKEVVRLDPIDSEARYWLGMAYQKSGSVQEAVQNFRRVSFLDPQNPEVYRHLGEACYRAGLWEDAELSFKKAIELDPRDYSSCYFLGLILKNDEKRANDSEEFFRKVIRLNPNFSGGYQELGYLYVQKGDYKNAIRMFRDVIRLDQDQKQAHYQLGFAYAMMHDMESARREYNLLKDIDPDLAHTLGMLLSRR